MCWISNNKPVLRVAEEDIPVVKVVKVDGNKIFSYFANFKYELGSTYTTRLEVKESEGFYGICEGFHSYPNNCEFAVDLAEEKEYTVFTHNYASASYYNYGGNLKTVRMDCVIPKGSEYYINDFDDIVSSQIKPVKIIDIKDVAKKL